MIDEKSMLARLLPKISIDAKTECWNWISTKYDTGYGQFWAHGKHQKAHRISYQLHRGEIPHGLCVLHKCDNRRCVNPDHLFLGTISDNNADKVAKGRQARFDRRGTANYRAKLTDLDVAEIRAANGILHRQLAEQYGISGPQISLIRSGKRW